MSYTYNKPDATDTISSSQSVIKDNFTAINGLVDVNHATFGDPNEGKHKTVSISAIIPSGSLPIETLANEYALYTTAAGLWLRPPSQAAGNVGLDLNLTEFDTTNYEFTLSNGFRVKWGQWQIDTTYAVTPSPKVFYTPFPNNCYAVFLTPCAYTGGDARNSVLMVYNKIKTQFQVERAVANINTTVVFYWLAIGN